MALEAYYRELAKLQQSGGSLPNFPNLPGLIALQQQAVLNGAQDLSVKKEQQQQLQQDQQQQQQQMQQHHQPIKMNGQHTLSVDEVSGKKTFDVQWSNDQIVNFLLIVAPATVAAFTVVGIQLGPPETRAGYNSNNNRFISRTESAG